MLDYFQTLYDYNSWANRCILQATAGLSEADQRAPMPYGHGSLHETLVHILGAEWIWRSRWQGVSPTAVLRAADLPTLEAVRARWQAEEQAMRAFLAGLRDEDLKRAVHYTNTRGEAHAAPLWQLMAHLLNHGTHHRSEAAAILTALGRSPGDLDLLVFVRLCGS
jgi:uncharacterized damage-inducible protein DinB